MRESFSEKFISPEEKFTLQEKRSARPESVIRNQLKINITDKAVVAMERQGFTIQEGDYISSEDKNAITIKEALKMDESRKEVKSAYRAVIKNIAGDELTIETGLWNDIDTKSADFKSIAKELARNKEWLSDQQGQEEGLRPLQIDLENGRDMILKRLPQYNPESSSENPRFDIYYVLIEANYKDKILASRLEQESKETIVEAIAPLANINEYDEMQAQFQKDIEEFYKQ